ncbi:MAG TPA: hypothetical protein PLZ10_04605, partial [Chitinophagaceae bacterium]|nr:hypothetical protein [Chitinophagaceae bacterium]
MKQNQLLITICALLFLVSCKKEKNDENETLSLTVNGLEDLGANARYEGWLIVSGNPVTTGTFSVNATGQLSASSFSVNKGQ